MPFENFKRTDSESASWNQPSQPNVEGDVEQWRPVGFRAPSATATAPKPNTKTRPMQAVAKKRRSAPIPSRPKGRIFTGCAILLLMALPSYMIFNSYFRYPARGVVQGRVVEISSPWQGTVATMHVREGESVRQGQPLMTLRKLTLEHELDSLQDQLRQAQAGLKAQAAQLTWQAELRGDHSYKAWGEYYEAWGNLMKEKAVLDEAIADEQRQDTLREQSVLVVSDRQWDKARFTVAGQRAKVEKLEESVQQLKQRAELYETPSADVTIQMKPQLAGIETLQAEISRLRELADEGIVRSPVNGHVVRLHHFAGEVALPTETAIEVVEDGSLEIVFYVPQHHANQMEIGREMQVTIEPNDEKVNCIVERIGQRLEEAPTSLERHYVRNARLLPVVAHPTSTLDHVFLGSEVKMSWSHLLIRTREASGVEDNTASVMESTNTQTVMDEIENSQLLEPTL